MPVYFENIIGNDKLKAMLSSYIEKRAMPHAFIIEGACGSGKKLIAKSVVASLCCKQQDGGLLPCQCCINCEKIFKNVSPDVIIIDSGSKQSIGVDTIRELKSHTYMSSNELEMKAYIIDGADKMTVQAQNAFLKILEEPVTDVMYFLLCENSRLLLPTVISRAPILRTSPVGRKQTVAFLKEKAVSADDEKIKKVAAMSAGNIGKALMLCMPSPELEEAEKQREAVYEFLSIISEKSTKYDYMQYWSAHIDKNNVQIELLRLIYSSLRDLIAQKELNDDRLDFFIDSEDAARFLSKIKPKYAKKLCMLIENTIEQLYINQGASSVSSIMLTFAIKAYNART